MPANLWKSLTVRFMAPGHTFQEVECIAAVIVTDCLVMYTIMGYRFSDAEREQLPAFFFRPETRFITLAGHCGTIPEGVDRDGIVLHGQLNPGGPGSRREWNGVADRRGISPAVMQDAPVVCW